MINPNYELGYINFIHIFEGRILLMDNRQLEELIIKALDANKFGSFGTITRSLRMIIRIYTVEKKPMRGLRILSSRIWSTDWSHFWISRKSMGHILKLSPSS